MYGNFFKDLRPILAKVEKSFSHTLLNYLGSGPNTKKCTTGRVSPSREKLSKIFLEHKVEMFRGTKKEKKILYPDMSHVANLPTRLENLKYM